MVFEKRRIEPALRGVDVTRKDGFDDAGCNALSALNGTDTEGCEVGLDMLARGDVDAAMAHFAALLQTDCVSQAVYEAASAALLAAADGASALPLPSQWTSLAQGLALQARGDASPPVLARRLAAPRSELPDLAAVATPMGRLLADLDDRGMLNKNAVLLLLVLRDQALPGWGPERISALHLRWFRTFTFSDLALPYSALFGASVGHLNREDLRRYAVDDPDGFRRSGAVPLTHLVFLEWLLQSDVFDSEEAWTRAIERRLAAGLADGAESLAAAKSAALRHRLVAASPKRLRAAHREFESLPSIVETAATGEGAARASATASADLARFESRRWQRFQVVRNVALAHLPFARAAHRRLKVAVCVSGQLRGYREAFSSWQRAFLRTVQPTLFVHSWKNLGRSGAHPSRYVLPFEGQAFIKTYREVCHEANFDEFRSRYPALFALLSMSNTLSHETVAAFYGTEHVALDDEADAPFAGMTNPQKMHYKIWACHRMAMASGQDFDLVVRLRPDKPIELLGFGWHALARLCRGNATLFADHPYGIHYGLLGIGDQFAVGTPETVAAYADAWVVYPRLAAERLLNCPPDFQGHFSLGQVCWTQGIAVRKIPMRFGKLLDAEPLDPASVADALSRDAAGRMDAVDRRLLEAAGSDCA